MIAAKIPTLTRDGDDASSDDGGDASTDGPCLPLSEVEFIEEELSRPETPQRLQPLSWPAASQATYVVFTSGSTGSPKGVVGTLAGLTAYGAAKNSFHRIDGDARVLLTSAATWDPALGDVFPTLVAGATLCIAPRALIIQQLGGVLQQTRATHVFATPALWSLVGAVPDELPNLKCVALGGEPIPRTVVESWAPAVDLINTYGVTEATVCQTAVRMSTDTPPSCVGTALPGVKVKISEDGELLVGGDQVTLGYIGDAGTVKGRFFTGVDGVSWVRTGDLACTDETNHLCLTGRIGNQIKLRGFRIELEEVESVLSGSPLVVAALVAKRENPARLVAYIRLCVSDEAYRAGGEVALRLLCEQKLPEYAVPTQFVKMDAMPLTDSGKLSRRLLPDVPLNRSRDTSDDVPEIAVDGSDVLSTLQTETEKAVARVWQDVLGVTNIRPCDHFFELGGTSVTSTLMIRRLADDFASNEACRHARFEANPDYIKVRLCGLHRRPRLRDYARLLDWAGLSAPTVQGEAGSALAGQLHGSERVATAEEILAALDASAAVGASEALGDALNVAVQGGHVEVVSALLTLGVSPDGKASRGFRATSPLMTAAAADRPLLAKLLLDAGAKVNLTNSSQSSALHIAAEFSAVTAQVLLDCGAAKGSRDLNRWTPLHRATWCGNLESVKVLVEARVDLAAKDRWCRTGLSLAVFQNNIDVAKFLFEAGAPLHPRFEKGRSRPQSSHQRRTGDKWAGCMQAAVRHAVAGKGIGMLNLLLDHKCPVDERDDDRATALHEIARAECPLDACEVGHNAQIHDIVGVLLRHGASVSATTTTGDTPLHDAVAHGNSMVVDALTSHGADKHVKNARGLMPCEVDSISRDQEWMIRRYEPAKIAARP